MAPTVVATARQKPALRLRASVAPTEVASGSGSGSIGKTTATGVVKQSVATKKTGSASASSSGSAAGSAATTGPYMQSTSDTTQVIILHTNSGLVYSCPDSTDTWTHNNIHGNITTSEATGYGCTVSYQFEGDSVQIYGATATNGGPFGCSILNNKVASGWWNGQGTGNYFVPYAGSCMLSGLGWGKHTVVMYNTFNSPQSTLYISGLRYTIDQTAQPEAVPGVYGCCATYIFPAGATTTMALAGAGATGVSGNGTSTVADPASLANVLGLSFAALAMVALASLIIGAMCCKKRRPSKRGEDSGDPTARIIHIHQDHHEKKPLRRRGRRSKHDTTSTDSDSSTGSSTGSSSGSESTDSYANKKTKAKSKRKTYRDVPNRSRREKKGKRGELASMGPQIGSQGWDAGDYGDKSGGASLG